MKERIIILVVMLALITSQALAIDHQFGGMWYTRAYINEGFSGDENDETWDLKWVDTRTRIFYTAVINENLKFVNKFEVDAVWGQGGVSYGDFGADGIAVEVKNSYADFTMGPVNFTVGVQGVYLARGFIFDDDASGAIITYNGNNFSIPLFWLKANEGGMGSNQNDVDYFGLTPTFTPSDTLSLVFYLLYVASDDASVWPGWYTGANFGIYDDFDSFYVGLDVDATFDKASVWFTGLYQGGSADVIGANDSTDFSAWLAGVGGAYSFGIADIHGEIFYATGDDDPNDLDRDDFFIPGGQSHYWAEIMGYGIFDWQCSNGSPWDQISNVLAVNLGTKVTPIEKLSISFDLWYAVLAEDDANNEDDLGIEADLKVSYELVEGMSMDVVGAYLFAGDATTGKVQDEADPYELGLQLSFEF